MGKREKKFNKWIVGAIIGGTILSIGGLSMTPKGKNFWQKVLKKLKKIKAFFIDGFQELMRILRK